ncbi:MAG: hypothetical protein M1282_18920, partial [Chloroflexi bacterium]|nr:hypothetical protein [Chloroflexota bacterium]
CRGLVPFCFSASYLYMFFFALFWIPALFYFLIRYILDRTRDARRAAAAAAENGAPVPAVAVRTALIKQNGKVLVLLGLFLAAVLLYVYLGTGRFKNPPASFPQGNAIGGQEEQAARDSGNWPQANSQQVGVRAWKKYASEKLGFEVEYPESYNNIQEGWNWGDFDVHFISTQSAIHILAESTKPSASGVPCFHGLCMNAAVRQFSSNGLIWDYLGQTIGSGYGIEGENAPTEFSGRFSYRTTYGGNRYYVLFDSDGQENEEVVRALKFFR